MGSFVADPGDAIADAIVEFLNDPLRDYYLDIQSENPDDPREALKREDQTLRVLVFPSEASEEKEGRGGQVLAEERVNVIVRATLDEELTRRHLLGLSYEIKRSLRGVTMAGWVWSTTETLSKFDLDTLQESDVILAAFRVGYIKMRTKDA